MLECCPLDEYLKIVDIVGQFDTRILTVKSWGVTLSLVALGLGFKERVWGYFFLAFLSGVAFWGIEYKLKGHQMKYYPRMAEIEYACSLKCTDAPLLSPRIDTSWESAGKILNGKITGEQASKMAPSLRGEYKYYTSFKRPFMVHLMMPHVFSVFFGALFGFLAYKKKWRFKEYGD